MELFYECMLQSSVLEKGLTPPTLSEMLRQR